MAFRRGFKTTANELSADIRSEMGLGPFDRLDPRRLAEHLEIPVFGLSAFVSEAPTVSHLMVAEPDVFSAVTVFCGPRRTIVHNDSHALVRQNSNLSHELSHGLLGHPPTPALDDTGCRVWNQDLEDEASWLGGCLLISEAATLAIARGRWTEEQATVRFGVSAQMIRFRVNATGAIARVRRSSFAGKN
jgi:Zn-dependent peptidase ImmA (M78 family)